ncbi:MAG: FixH family protein [Bacteroidota bacterium]
MSKPLIPPHISWPAFIIALLGMSVAGGVWSVIKANGFGKAEVVSDYHQQALDFNTHLAEQTASNMLGWQSTLDIEAGNVVVKLTDREGAPVFDATVLVTPARPESAAPESTLTLIPSPDVRGQYSAPVLLSRPGRWRFAVRAERADDVHLADLRRDVRF